MRKIIEYFNKNRKKILLIFLAIVLFIIVTRILNVIIKDNTIEEGKNTANTLKDTTLPTETIISDTEISVERAKDNKQIIENFVQACNNKQYESAFAMISNECKLNVFSGNISNFINNYCNKVFSTSKTYKLEAWFENDDNITYKINYLEDNILATGGANLNELNYMDYITIVYKSNLLNIGEFVDETNISRKTSIKDIEVQVNKKKTFINYAIYNFKIKNNTDKTILLSDYSDSKQICLLSEYDSENISYLNEVPITNLIINSGEEKVIDIKFDKGYGSGAKTDKIKFKNIYLDYNEYKQNPNDENLEKVEIEIKL